MTIIGIWTPYGNLRIEYQSRCIITSFLGSLPKETSKQQNWNFQGWKWY